MTNRRIEGRIEAVCFDATGTLFALRETVGTTYARHARAVGIALPAWRLDDAFARVLRHGPSLSEAVVALGVDASRGAREATERAWWQDRVRQTFQATDSTVRFPDPDAFFAGLFSFYSGAEAWQIRPGIQALLERLQRRGLPLGVLSHFDHRLLDLLESLGLKAFFRSIEIPCQRGLAKPDRRACEALATALGCPLERLAYVGDDAPATLEALTAHGLATFDVRDPDALDALESQLLAGAEVSSREAAKLAQANSPDETERADSTSGPRNAR